MIIGTSMLIISLIYLLLTSTIYYSKKRIKNEENRIYNYMIITSFVGIILEICCIFLVPNKEELPVINEFVNRAFLIYILTWIFLFTKYIITISFDNNKSLSLKINKNIKKIDFILMVIYILFGISLILLPIKYFYDGVNVYSYGTATQFLYFVNFVVITIWFICLILNHGSLGYKKYIPLFTFLFGAVLNMIIREINPGILLITVTQTFITIMMYFTIENPDVKMVNQLEYAKAQADKANKAKSEFLSSMSHEIRTPMNGIVGIAEYLRNENLSDEGRSLLDDLERVSNTLLEITSGIINISKIEQGAVDIVEKDYNIRETVDDICTYLKPRLKDRPIDFKVEYAPDLPEILFGDKGKIREIITNLLTNSIKYTEQGSINLNIMCINESDCCKLTIIVSDTGIGIREEMMNKLFEKFARDEDVTNTTIEGTGLGLAITKKLVDMLNGKITVSSVRGNGTTFTVYLAQKYSQNKTRITEIDEETKEVIKQEEKVEPIEEVKDKEIETLEDNTNTTKVLIVDDNDLNLKVQKRHLDEYGYQVDTCKSGEECLKILENNKYDLILMDDMMPDISGTETMKKIKNDLKLSIPIVVVTGNAKEEDRDNYLKEGFDEYLAKPFKKEELKEVIKKVGLLRQNIY